MKILELNGLKYSRSDFGDYYYRLILELKTVDGANRITIYTTDTDKENIKKVLYERQNEKVISSNIIHWATKEQDDIASKFIDEWLETLKNE